MEDCIRLQHKIEFVGEINGVITWHCVPCDKDHSQFNDCCAGR